MFEISPSELLSLKSEQIASWIESYADSSQYEAEKQPNFQKIIVDQAVDASLLNQPLLRLLTTENIDRILVGQAIKLDACFSGVHWDAATLHRNFERLVLTYQAYLLVLAYRILGNWQAAEDVVQDAWTKAFATLKRRCEQGERVDMSHARGFLGVIVRNAAYNYRDRERRFVPLEVTDRGDICGLEAVEADKFEQPELYYIRDESRLSLGALICYLPVNYRMVIILRFYQEHSYDEIAKILKRPIGTVKCYQNRGLKMLRQAVKEQGVIPEDLDVWSDYSHRDGFLWNYMMRYKDVGKIA